ncbi:MAG: SDR family oxidoreductase [Syntrophaceae bacterium]|nr:SDR family oxidoreductase [Syntrophaceae bacterium]
MKIGIIGATRGIGYALLTLALEEGHEVTVLARDPKRLKISDPRLKVIPGDIVDPGAVASLVKGQDAICSCIGIMPTWKPVDVFSRGAANILLAMGKDSKQKYVSVTGIGAGDSKGHGGFLYDRLFNPLFVKTIYTNKNREEALIMVSRIQWMIVRPGFLTNGPRTGKYRAIVDLTGIKAGKISRLDVADFILKELKNPRHFRQTPLLTY